MIEFVSDREVYDRVVCRVADVAERFVWIATADLKNMHIEKAGRWRPFLEDLSTLVARNVEIRLLHAKEPGPLFRRDFDKYPNLIGGMERILCPRVHFKMVIVDGGWGYTGSANFTGAGMGGKGDNRRNFEAGILTDDPGLLEAMIERFDAVWRGQFCTDCERKKYCANYKDMAGR